MISWIRSYFRWLGDGPKGGVEDLPVVSERYESSIPGIYIIGDLTGIPLLKFAVLSGQKVWDVIEAKEPSHAPKHILDAVIIGAGPSGVACTLEALHRKKEVVLLESNQPFQTLVSYTDGKPIFAVPESLEISSPLQIENGTKESLLNRLRNKKK